MSDKEYMDIAKKACEYSYSPDSNFKTGACLVTESGKYFTGCNVENDGIQSICCERVAFVKALSSGERAFSKIYVVGTTDLHNFVEAMPCGYCRQFMSEFVDADFKVYVEKNNKIKEYSFKELLPHSFKF